MTTRARTNIANLGMYRIRFEDGFTAIRPVRPRSGGACQRLRPTPALVEFEHGAGSARELSALCPVGIHETTVGDAPRSGLWPPPPTGGAGSGRAKPDPSRLLWGVALRLCHGSRPGSAKARALAAPAAPVCDSRSMAEVSFSLKQIAFPAFAPPCSTGRNGAIHAVMVQRRDMMHGGDSGGRARLASADGSNVPPRYQYPMAAAAMTGPRSSVDGLSLCISRPSRDVARRSWWAWRARLHAGHQNFLIER